MDAWSLIDVCGQLEEKKEVFVCYMIKGIVEIYLHLVSNSI
jgi:hypothetical protein